MAAKRSKPDKAGKTDRAALRALRPKQRVSTAYGFVAPAGVLQQQRVDHAIAHTARIQQMLEKPTLSAESRKLLEDALEDYRDLIHDAGPEALAQAHEFLGVQTPADLTPDHLTRAVSHLRG